MQEGLMTGVDQRQTELMQETVPFAGALGVEVVANRPDEVRARVAWSPERCTTAGVLHGGVIMSLADTTGATCAFQNLPEGPRGRRPSRARRTSCGPSGTGMRRRSRARSTRVVRST
jgi:acyl-coenzyme A thioesterase PaaI-like protein